jgi:2-phosphoglycerate kinase
MERPTVLIIGGAPLVGTAEVARKIAARWEYGCLSTDDLIQAVRAVTTSQSHPQFHLLQQKDHRQYFITHTVNRLATDLQYQNESVWPTVKKVIEHHIEAGTGIVIEGWALLPDRIAKLELPRISSLWLMADEAFFQRQVQQEHDFFKTGPMEDVFARKFAARSTTINENIRKAADVYNLPIIEIIQDDTIENITDRSLCVLSS